LLLKRCGTFSGLEVAREPDCRAPLPLFIVVHSHKKRKVPVIDKIRVKM
jgi:hypothetical protein